MSKSSIVLKIEKFIKDVENRPAIWNRSYHCNKQFLEQMWVELSEIHSLPIVVLKAKWKGLRDNFRVEYKRIPRVSENGDFLIAPENYESKWVHYYTLLFLTEHMRHRMPKSEQETSSFYFGNNSGDYEQTLVEPDLSNGLIRIPDSDEEFDEDDDEDIVVDTDVTHMLPHQTEVSIVKTKPLTRASLSKINCKIEKEQSSSGDGRRTSSVTSSLDGSRNGPAPIALKRQRLSEDDSNFNGSSTMDVTAPDDDDYHYLLSLHPYMKQLTAAQKLRIRTKIQKLIFKELYKEDLEETK